MIINDLYEIWLPIIGYEGLYEVSSWGRIRSLNYYCRGKHKILKLSAKPNTYIKVGLRKDGTVKYYRVHRLVAEAFLPNPLNLPQVNHIDGNKQNNAICNIEWVSAKQNTNNPNTKPNMSIRYHKEGEFERRSAAQKKRMKEHPEDLWKMWNGRLKTLIMRGSSCC